MLENRQQILRKSLVLGFPNGGGSVVTPLLRMDNHGCIVERGAIVYELPSMFVVGLARKFNKGSKV